MSDVLFNSELWRPALEKYAVATHTTVKLFNGDLQLVFGPIHPTPLFQQLDGTGYDPGFFAECARQCLHQTTDRPAVTVSKVYGLAVIGTSLVLEGKVVGAAVAGYVFVDFSEISEIRILAREARIDFERVWQVARAQKPVPQGRLTVYGELLQVMGDALLRENARTRQYEQAVVDLEDAARSEALAHREMRQTASVLRESEGRYRTLFDLGPVAVYSCDASGVIRDFNRVAVELWGREPKHGDTDELWCGSFKMLQSDGAVPPHEQCPMAAVLSGRMPEVRDGEVQIERPDGSRVTVLVNIRPLKNEQGEITGAINCFVDITERKQAEIARVRLAAIVESSDDAIVSKDMNGTITSWNHGAERLFGYLAQEAIGKSITMLIPSDRLDEEPAILECIRRGGHIEHYETVRRAKDGSLRDVSLTVSPIVDSRGRIVGASKIARNITDRKRADDALKESHANLESLVDQRTRALRELSSSLMRAQDDERRRIARELHDSVGQYLAHAKMALSTLKRTMGTKRGTDSLSQVEGDLNQCLLETRTISHLLHPPLLDEVGLQSALEWYVAGFGERTGIQVNLSIPSEMARFSSELELVLFRVLQESLTNILRHAKSKVVDVQVELGAGDIALKVKDYGVGMTAEFLAKFKSGAGGGVGLRSMSERTSELGGRFEIESDKSGTTIRATFPLSHTGKRGPLAMAAFGK